MKKRGELGKELSIGYVSCIVKMHYWQPYRRMPLKMSWPSLASPFKKAGAATSVASIPYSYLKTSSVSAEVLTVLKCILCIVD